MCADYILFSITDPTLGICDHPEQSPVWHFVKVMLWTTPWSRRVVLQQGDAVRVTGLVVRSSRSNRSSMVRYVDQLTAAFTNICATVGMLAAVSYAF